MMPKHAVPFTLLACISTACDSDWEPRPFDDTLPIPSTESFAPHLSDYDLFTAPMSDLSPSSGTHLYELSSELFSDYAKKQRLIRLPEGETIDLQSPDPWAFPDGTIIAKTCWEQAVNTLCAQGRFKARGSEAYLTWCRVLGRNDEGVEYFLGSLQDIELTELQHLSDWHCEAYLAQGFSCMLDTQRPAHIEQALEVIGELEPVLTWKGQSIFYALACVTSRAGQTKRALQYAERSVELGHKVKPMLTDPDFANLRNDAWAGPRLRNLKEKS